MTSQAIMYSVAILVAIFLNVVYCFHFETKPKSRVTADGPDVKTFVGNRSHIDHFTILKMDSTSMLVGGRNRLYDLHLSNLTQRNTGIEWEAGEAATNICRVREYGNLDTCQNYIQVGYTENNKLNVCGTKAHGPKCMEYQYSNGKYTSISQETDGTSKCGFGPQLNSTSVYADNNLYSATRIKNNRDAIIMRQGANKIRTPQSDSTYLNDPQFISSFEHEDKVYFFFREIALEYTSGKMVYPRVARVCKNDSGSNFAGPVWMTFFKARLNCSIPGEFPFYFNDIQSTSEIKGGVLYAVFNTPNNAITGSAVCSFSMHDINTVFKGAFKEKQTWMPVQQDRAPMSHLASRCPVNTKRYSATTQTFISEHPLMNGAVPGSPQLVRTGSRSTFTKIAIDWAVGGVEGTYDIMFVGTADGRVLKTISTGNRNGLPDSVFIEEIQVFSTPITDIKVLKNGNKIIVVSKYDIKSLPLYRCSQHNTCRKCVALQDPHCSWKNGVCGHHTSGSDRIQSITTGVNAKCPPEPTDSIPVTNAPTNNNNNNNNIGNPSPSGTKNGKQLTSTPHSNIVDPNARVGARILKEDEKQYSAMILAVAVSVSIVLSLFFGFFVGNCFSTWKRSRNIGQETPSFKDDRNVNRKTHNPYDDMTSNHNDSNHSYHNNHSLQKQLNVVMNVKSKMPETKSLDFSNDTLNKPKKVYL